MNFLSSIENLYGLSHRILVCMVKMRLTMRSQPSSGKGCIIPEVCEKF
jgi:hypothetical protein